MDSSNKSVFKIQAYLHNKTTFQNKTTNYVKNYNPPKNLSNNSKVE